MAQDDQIDENFYAKEKWTEVDENDLTTFQQFGITPFAFTTELVDDVLEDLDFGDRALQMLSAISKSHAEYLFMHPQQLTELRVYSQDEGGYQRDMIQSKIKKIATLASLGLKFPPILVARVKEGGKTILYIIDGHHRTCGCRIAKVGLHALVVTCDLDELARFLYLIHNTSATKAGQASQRASSTNPQALAEKKLASDYDATGQQIMRLVCGIVNGNAVHPDYVSPDHAIAPKDFKLAKLVLDIWTDSALWHPSSESRTKMASPAELYSSIGVMQVLGMMAQDRRDDPALLKKEILMFKNMKWAKNTAFAKLMGSGQGQVGDMKRYVDTTVLKGKAPKGKPSAHTRGSKLVSV